MKSYEPMSLAASRAWKASTPSALCNGRAARSIYDGLPLIAEVRDEQINVSIDFTRRAAFLVYAIVEN